MSGAAAVAAVSGAASDPAAAPSSSWELEEGDPIAGDLVALRKLGGGHRYEALLAWDEHRRSTVVAKLVRPDRIDDHDTLNGLAEEVAALRALQHPVIVRGFGAVQGGPRPHIVLEHLEGPRLSSLIRRYGPLGPEQLAPLAIQLAAAAHYMHAEDWVHLDIKPANVIMGSPPRLIDLSVACRCETAARLEAPIGTDSYMAPEQCRPGSTRPIGPSADVFGLGVTLYRAATGERPFALGDEDSPDPERRWPQLVAPPVPLAADLPASAIEMIEACLAYDSEQRPEPAEVAVTFEAMLAGLPRPRLGRLKPRWS